MARIPASVASNGHTPPHDPFAGVDAQDPDPDVRAQILTLLDELPESTQLPDVVASLDFCTLKTFTLLPSGLGFKVEFEVPLSQKDKLPALVGAHQRLVCVHVVRQRQYHE